MQLIQSHFHTTPPNPFSRLPEEVTKQILDYVWGSTASSPPDLKFHQTGVPYLIHLGSVCQLFRQLSHTHLFWCEHCHWHELLIDDAKASVPALLEAYDVFSKEYRRFRGGFKKIELDCKHCRFAFMPTSFWIPFADITVTIQKSHRFLRRVILYSRENAGNVTDMDANVIEAENWSPPSNLVFKSPIFSFAYTGGSCEFDEFVAQQPDIEMFHVFDNVMDLKISDDDRLLLYRKCRLSLFPNIIQFRACTRYRQFISSLLDIDKFCPSLQHYIGSKALSSTQKP